METVKYLCKKYDIDLSKRSPFEIKCGRWHDLPKIFNELGFKTGAEIGVLKGDWSKNLFKYIPDLKMYCIDKWKQYPTYKDFRNQKKLDGYYDETKKKLKNLNCKIIKKWSMDAVKAFEDESLDFVFIDGNHTFEYVTNDIAEWSKKVRKGGIISGHDYFRSVSGIYIHVKDVVQGWTYAHRIHPWFLLEGCFGKEEIYENKYKSWMWVKK